MPSSQTFSFKSTPENYEKELDGRKPNTVRRIAEGDPRRNIKPGDIVEIVNTETGRCFARRVVDVTIWEELHIISWNDEEPW